MNARKELISKLQRDILLWQGFKPLASDAGEAIGLGEIETAFPGCIFPRKAIHEFIAVMPEHSAATGGFISALLSVLMKDGAACVWISTSRKLFPVSLCLFNVDTERIIFIDVAKEKDVLWIMEEALKCEGLAAAVAEVKGLSVIESRRLQLAVEKTSVTGFILRKDARQALTSMVTARWKITPLPSETEIGMPGIGFPRWNVELMKVRHGNPGNWIVEWGGDRFVEIPKVGQKTVEFIEEERKIG